MLLVRFLLEEYDRQSSEVKSDLSLTIQEGIERGYLTITQVRAIVLQAYGYTFEQINEKLSISNAQELILAGLRYISSASGYTDESVLYSRKGYVKEEWIAKAKSLAMKDHNE